MYRPLKAGARVLPLLAPQVAVQLEVARLELRVVLLQQVGLPLRASTPPDASLLAALWLVHVMAGCSTCLQRG
jgi:hypothetical protein